MARFFDKATRADALEVLTPIAATYPFTASAWFQMGTVGGGTGGFILASSDPSATTNYWNLNVAWGGAGQLQFYQGANSGLIFGSGANLSDFNWHHIACVITNATTRALYVDGVKTAGSGTSVTMTGLSQLLIGGFYSTGGSPVRNPGYDGNLAEIAGWNVALTDPEMVALARGASPMRVRPSGLILYYPLTDGADSKYLRNRFRNATDRSLTEIGTGTQACSDGTHPPVQPGFGFVGGWRGTTPPLSVTLTAPDLGTSSPVLDVPVLVGPTVIPGATAYFKVASDAGTTDATGYSTITSTLLGVSSVAWGTTGDIVSASNLVTSSPSIGVGSLVQNFVLAATSLAITAPAIGATAVKQTHVLLASAASAGAPTLGVPAVGVTVALAAPALSAGAPALGVPLLGQSYVTTAPSFTESSPFLGVPAFGQSHTLTAAFALSSPAIGAGVLAQTHLLAATNLAAGSPVIPAAFSSQSYALSAAALAVGSPFVGAAAITGQTHVLVAANLVTGLTVLLAAVLHQKQVLVATGTAIGAPVLGAPAFAAGRFITAPGLAIASPTMTAAVLAQKHTLAPASALSAGSPFFGAPAPPLITRLLTATPLATGSPTITSTVLFRAFPLLAGSLAVGSPVFGTTGQLEELLPPLVWLLHRLKRWSNDPEAEYYDEDGTEDEGPVQQAIFTNKNDAIELWCSPGSLPGRTSPGFGPVELIQVAAPLQLSDRQLLIDWGDVDQLQSDLTAEIAARTAAIAALTNAVNVNTAAIAANVAAIAANTNAINTNSALLTLIASDLDRLRQIGVAPAAAWRNFIPRDLMSGRPALPVPTLVVH